jgi:hypothetical protein
MTLLRGLPDGHVVSAAEVEAELQRIGHVLRPGRALHVSTFRLNASIYCRIRRVVSVYQ